MRRQFADWSANRFGNVAVIFGLALPALLTFVGAAVDYGNLVAGRAQMQTAADAAALHGARELRLSNATAATVQQDAQNFALANLKGGNFTPTITPNADMVNRIVTVTVSANVPTYVMKFLGAATANVSATASAKVKGGDPLCVVGLNSKANFTIEMDKNAALQAPGCVVYSNSTNANGLMANNNATLSAAMICTAGGKSGAGPGSFAPTPQTDCPVMPDPLAGRPAPAASTCKQTGLVVNNGMATTLFPGTYCGGLTITGGAQVSMASGVYVIKDGPLYVGGGATMTGVNVGFYFTGSGAVLNLDTDSNVSLTAPNSGIMAGLLFWEDAGVASGQTHQIISNNARNMLGTIYLPVNKFYVAANAPVADQSQWTVVVVNQFALSEGPTMVLNTNYGSTDIPVPNGVGPGGATQLIK